MSKYWRFLSNFKEACERISYNAWDFDPNLKISTKIRAYNARDFDQNFRQNRTKSELNLRDLDPNFGKLHHNSIIFEQNVKNFDDQAARDFDQNVGETKCSIF